MSDVVAGRQTWSVAADRERCGGHVDLVDEIRAEERAVERRATFGLDGDHMRHDRVEADECGSEIDAVTTGTNDLDRPGRLVETCRLGGDDETAAAREQFGRRIDATAAGVNLHTS